MPSSRKQPPVLVEEAYSEVELDRNFAPYIVPIDGNLPAKGWLPAKTLTPTVYKSDNVVIELVHIFGEWAYVSARKKGATATEASGWFRAAAADDSAVIWVPTK